MKPKMKKVKQCEWDGCKIYFKKHGNKMYCPTHSDEALMMRYRKK